MTESSESENETVDDKNTDTRTRSLSRSRSRSPVDKNKKTEENALTDRGRNRSPRNLKRERKDSLSPDKDERDTSRSRSTSPTESKRGRARSTSYEEPQRYESLSPERDSEKKEQNVDEKNEKKPYNINESNKKQKTEETKKFSRDQSPSFSTKEKQSQKKQYDEERGREKDKKVHDNSRSSSRSRYKRSQSVGPSYRYRRDEYEGYKYRDYNNNNNKPGYHRSGWDSPRLSNRNKPWYEKPRGGHLPSYFASTDADRQTSYTKREFDNSTSIEGNFSYEKKGPARKFDGEDLTSPNIFKLATDGRFFLGLALYVHHEDTIKPSEISLRWTDGTKFVDYLWHVKSGYIGNPHLKSYKDSVDIYGLKQKDVNTLPDALFSDEVFRTLETQLKLHPRDPIYCLDINKKIQWLCSTTFIGRLRDYNEHITNFKEMNVNDGQQQKTVSMWNLATRLSHEGKCSLHKSIDIQTNWQYDYQCAHAETLRMKNHWLLSTHLQI